jgi:adenosylcobinamide-GDP ribazoletransferase
MPAAESLAVQARAAAAAVSFLTRVPLARRLEVDGDDLTRGAVAFPLVGAVIGGAAGAAAFGLAQLLPALAAGGLALVLGAALTGAIHLDALADTADALAARSRERALEIMRDPAIGAYGATALVLDLIVKAAALGTLAERARVIWFAATAGALARATPVVLAAILPKARADGSGATFSAGVSSRSAVGASLVAAGLAVALMSTNGIALAGVAAAVVVLLALSLTRWLGGVTGDTLGAAVEITETLALAAAVALVR